MNIKIYGTRCLNCGKEIPFERRSVKYCSAICGDRFNRKQYKKRNREKILALKKGYRERNKEKIKEYSKAYKIRGYKQMYKSQKDSLLNRDLIKSQGGCLKCGKREALEIHHIKPRIYGGQHSIGNVMLLCHKCHSDFEILTKEFWKNESLN